MVLWADVRCAWPAVVVVAGNACEYKDCPKATAWFDEAMGHGTAHRKAECSNRGLCTHDTGVCTCDSSNNKLNFIGKVVEASDLLRLATVPVPRGHEAHTCWSLTVRTP